jgi:hypothetical protein
MSDFWNKQTKEWRKSVHDPLYTGNEWVKTNGMTLPDVDPQLWKFDNGTIVAMSQVEVDALPKPGKTKAGIMHDIFAAVPPSEVNALLDSLDANPTFYVALDLGRLDVAGIVLERAKESNSVSRAHYDIIKAAL